MADLTCLSNQILLRSLNVKIMERLTV